MGDGGKIKDAMEVRNEDRLQQLQKEK